MKMKTPIIDFIEEYKNKKPLRLHTPGHKGFVFCGHEADDITEIPGADELFAPRGIIAESEKNASRLFGCPTYYSAEGSSLCVRAMIFMLTQRLGRPARILAGRNAHRSFVTAAAMTGADVTWISPHEGDGGVSVTVTADDVKSAAAAKPDAVYITSPDYLGKITDLRGIAEACRKIGAYLFVDCAHGAYLHFLPEPLDPVTLGADVCCTSAHKTLPALTGAAYLHTRVFSADEVRRALSAFASTSPSYLILQSLDGLNAYLSACKAKLGRFIPYADAARAALAEDGWGLYGDEPLKITLYTKKRGYTGKEAARYLVEKNVYPEYCDDSYVVFMINPSTGKRGLDRLVSTLKKLPRLPEIPHNAPALRIPERVMSIRDAFFAQKETLPTLECAGRIFGDAAVSCPPAVCPAVCGELISGECASYLLSLGITECSVVIPRREEPLPAAPQAGTDSSYT